MIYDDHASARLFMNEFSSIASLQSRVGKGNIFMCSSGFPVFLYLSMNEAAGKRRLQPETVIIRMYS